jgi:hypothetical protein
VAIHFIDSKSIHVKLRTEIAIDRTVEHSTLTTAINETTTRINKRNINSKYEILNKKMKTKLGLCPFFFMR